MGLLLVGSGHLFTAAGELTKASDKSKEARFATSDAWEVVEKQAIIFNCPIPTNAPGYRLDW
jgi:hypothetical protein